MAEQSVTLAPGESKVVAFEAIPTEARTYQVSVDGLTGTFEAMGEALTYTCPYCLASLSSLSEFFNHLENVHFYMPEDYFYCPYCGDDFSTMAAFFSHLEAEHIDDITAPPALPPDYLQNLAVSPLMVRQGDSATISGSFVGPVGAYTSYRLAFHYKGRTRPRAYGKITSAGAFSLTLPTTKHPSGFVPPGSYAITTTCAWREDPPGGPILERTIWLNAPTGLTITVLPA